MSIIAGTAIESALGGYRIERSLRFNSADSAYLSRTPSGTGGRSKFTYSIWLKVTKPSTQIFLLSAPFSTTQNGSTLSIESSGQFYAGLRLYNTGSQGTYDADCYSNMLFRDPSAWYHIVFSLDTTASSADAMKLYVNGVSQSFASYDAPTASAVQYIGSEFTHYIGSLRQSVGTLDGYLAETHFIDGQSLDASYFGETNTDTGVWQPKAYTGSYGTNGFYLDFADNSSTTALGYDAAGSNDWTPNNFSVTAGAGNDSLVDTPTPYGTDTGVGGEVRGNYATLNPNVTSDGSITYSDGNLQIDLGSTSSFYQTLATIGVSSGKWYWELVPKLGATVNTTFGVAKDGSTYDTGGIYNNAGFWIGNFDTGAIFYYYANGSSDGTTSVGLSAGAVIGLAFDADNGTLALYTNNTLRKTFTGLTTGVTYFPVFELQGTGSASMVINFGQRPFAYTAPSGFASLCTQNLPEPTVVDGGEYFEPALYTGTGSALSVTGLAFQPDLVWIKCRSAGQSHCLYDAVRGATKQLNSNNTGAESTYAGVSSFNSDGFSVGTADNNTASATYVAWNWKANGAGVSNTDGTITSTVSASTTAGFSICTYTGNGVDNSTIGHGLGAVPSMIILKKRSDADGWPVYHKSLTAGYELFLNTTAAQADDVNNATWGDNYPSGITASVFEVGYAGDSNNNGDTYVAYCFAPVESYSAMGSYQGNGSSEGPFVYTGFRPAFLLIKRTDSTSDWILRDSLRLGYNAVDTDLYADLSNAEATPASAPFDFVSNGFKIRGTGYNSSGATWIYMAFAENPFKYSLGR